MSAEGLRGALLASALLLPALGGAAPSSYVVAADGARIQFVVEAPLDDVPGLSRAVKGSLDVDVDDWGHAHGKLVVDLRSFRTGISLRDQDLRDQFFQADLYPVAVLDVARLERPSSPKLGVSTEAQADAVGTFTLHGEKREVRVPVKVTREMAAGQGVLRVRGAFKVPFADYKIQRPERLFLKLGDTANVSFEAVFVEQPKLGGEAVAATAPAANAPPPKPVPLPANVSLPAVPVFPVVARKHARISPEPKVHAPSFVYSLTKPEGRGERLFHDPAVGGPKNVIACAACHSVTDERLGIISAGVVKPDVSLWDGAHRGSYWRGLTNQMGVAVNLCVKAFMAKPEGASARDVDDLVAYLDKLSPDTTPPLDYSQMLYTRRTGIDRATDGNAKNGQQLVQRYCASCHADGGARPPLTRGLYEPDYLVRRVRRTEGADNQQMPLIGVDRLTDSELRDIVTYLAGDASERIFKRKLAAQ